MRNHDFFYSRGLSCLSRWGTTQWRTLADDVGAWLKGKRSRDDVEDVTQLLATWLGMLQRHEPDRFARLASSPEGAIRNFLRQQARWLDARRDPLAGVRHALAQHVGAVLDRRVPPAPDGLPETLHEHGRLSRRRIAEAVGEIVQGRPGAWKVAEVVSELVERYGWELDPSVAPSLPGDAETPEDAVRRARDGDRLAERAERLLRPEERRALAISWETGRIADVQAALGVERSRAYEIRERALEKVRKALGSREGDEPVRRRSRSTRAAAVKALRRRLRARP